jgi:hypothetical protein
MSVDAAAERIIASLEHQAPIAGTDIPNNVANQVCSRRPIAKTGKQSRYLHKQNCKPDVEPTFAAPLLRQHIARFLCGVGHLYLPLYIACRLILICPQDLETAKHTSASQTFTKVSHFMTAPAQRYVVFSPHLGIQIYRNLTGSPMA